MNNIAVYTANFGGKDEVHDVIEEEGVDYFYITDEPFDHDQWFVIESKFLLDTPRHSARFIKTQGYSFYPQYDYAIWMDASQEMKVPPSKFIQLVSDEKPIASFEHPQRDCIYEEAKACKGLDNQYRIDSQIEYYKREGYPEHNGLIESQVIVAKLTPEVANFFKLWGWLNTHFSQRDQLSANFAMWKLGLKWNEIPRHYAKKHTHKVHTTANT